jgi:hypothetical protein
MSEDKRGGQSGNYVFPTSDDLPRGAHQLAEGMVMFDLRPPSAEDVAMSAEIDEIHDRLARDIPKLQRDMNELLDRVRRPGLA